MSVMSDGKAVGMASKKHFGEGGGELARGGPNRLQSTCNPYHGCGRGKGIAEVLVINEVVLVKPESFAKPH